MREARLWAVLSLAILLLGCGPTATAYPVATDSVAITCQGGPVGLDSGLHLVLHGRMTDGTATIWVNDSTAVLWPHGYSARFEPALVVYDAEGVVRGREGEDMAATVPWHGQPICLNRNLDFQYYVLVWPRDIR